MFQVDSSFKKKNTRQKIHFYPLTYYPSTYIATEIRYTDSTGINVIIQNSLPKGGGKYTDPVGKTFGYAVNWTRIINESDAPIELTLNFPTDSFAINDLSFYRKFLLPPDAMTVDKEGLYAYGLTGLESFLDSALYKSTSLQITITPSNAYAFYIVELSYLSVQASTRQQRSKAGPRGGGRAGFVLKGRELFYYSYPALPKLDSASIPWGYLTFKK